jgi:O-antigen ligase
MYENPFGSGTADTGSAHSDYIDLLVRGGCLYLGLFLVSIGLMAYRLVRNAEQSPAQLATLLCLTVVMVSACAQNPLKTPQIVSLFWLLIGAAVGARPVCRAQSRGAIVVCSQSQSA